MHLRHRQSCRVCGSKSLTRVIDLGEQHLQGSFIKDSKNLPPLRKLPTSLVRCNPMLDETACGLLQMEYTVPPSILYSAYWYRSGTNSTMRNHLKGIADSILEMLPATNKRKRVLDIGCNDGTLLDYFPADLEKYGIDPSDIAAEQNISATIIHDLFPSNELEAILAGKKIDIITSIAMFYDLESPTDFVKAVKQHLEGNGLWVFEMSYMPTMLKKSMYDTICHEHLEYYSLSVIEYILKTADLKLVRAEINDCNGGSIRCYATHQDNFDYKDSSLLNEIKILRQNEFDMALDTDIPYQHFQDRINVRREELNSLIWGLKREGKRIHLYGASTKGNTILQWCRLDSRSIDMAAERNPEKFGAKTIGTDIPIVSETESRALKPDYYLVLPWHFKKEFLERERNTISQGSKFIFPLPTIEIIG